MGRCWDEEDEEEGAGAEAATGKGGAVGAASGPGAGARAGGSGSGATGTAPPTLGPGVEPAGAAGAESSTGRVATFGRAWWVGNGIAHELLGAGDAVPGNGTAAEAPVPGTGKGDAAAATLKFIRLTFWYPAEAGKGNAGMTPTEVGPTPLATKPVGAAGDGNIVDAEPALTEVLKAEPVFERDSNMPGSS